MSKENHEREHAIIEASVLLVTLLFAMVTLWRGFPEAELLEAIARIGFPFILAALFATIRMFVGFNRYVAFVFTFLELFWFILALGYLPTISTRGRTDPAFRHRP